ncbi:hypothetical protein GCAAIG_10185 [Candidatus Electronema halotolerans]
MKKKFLADEYALEEQLAIEGLKLKSPALAVFLGFFFPLIGYLYVGQIIGAIFITFFWILFFFLSAIFWPLFFSMPIFNIGCACSCYNGAAGINRKRVRKAIDEVSIS